MAITKWERKWWKREGVRLNHYRRQVGRAKEDRIHVTRAVAIIGYHLLWLESVKVKPTTQFLFRDPGSPLYLLPNIPPRGFNNSSEMLFFLPLQQSWTLVLCFYLRMLEQGIISLMVWSVDKINRGSTKRGKLKL